MSVFGGGYGKDSEIWGSTTINHNKGYAFQIFGGGEKGVVGKKNATYNAAYSSTVHLKGTSPIFSSDGTIEDLAESEYIGMGVERITNLKYRVKDLRLFSENDVRFLKQFESC